VHSSPSSRTDKIPGVSCRIVVSWDNNRGRREGHLPDSMCQLGPIPILLVNREYLYQYFMCLYTMIRRVIVVCSRGKRVASWGDMTLDAFTISVIVSILPVTCESSRFSLDNQ